MEINEEDKRAYYQLCPKCNGEGIVDNPLNLSSSSINVRTCPVCNGAKTFYHPSSRESILKEEIDRLKKENEEFLRSATNASQELIKSERHNKELIQKLQDCEFDLSVLLNAEKNESRNF